MKKFWKLASLGLAAVMSLAFFAGCGDDDGGSGNNGGGTGNEQGGNNNGEGGSGNNGGVTHPVGTFDNENDPLVFSTLALDRVFSPFFATSATDSNVVGLTQIGMLSNDKDGNVAYGDDEAVVVKDLQMITRGSGDEATTEYRFVLKNNIRFSNNTPLTIKDVLFNLYVYLDPAYTGSSTIYSTDIVGLKQYRTQEPDTDEAAQNAFMERFNTAAEGRMNALLGATADIKEEYQNENLNEAIFRQALQSAQDSGLYGESGSHLVRDFDRALELFKEELNTDYSNAMDSYADTVFTNNKGETVRNLLCCDAEQFLYNENMIQWSKKEGKLSYSISTPEAIREMLKPQQKPDGTTETELEVGDRMKAWAVDQVYRIYVPGKFDEVIQYWQTSSNLFDDIAAQEMQEYFASTTRVYKSIEGIRFANETSAVEVNGTQYAKPVYDADGGVKQMEGNNEVLSITIHKIDPKAIWNFSFAVAPMYYYSDADHINAYDGHDNFGVEYASQDFLQQVVNGPEKIGVPVGAGPYAASKSSGGITNIQSGDFYSLGVVYFERNPYYNPDGNGPAKIKKVRYQVTSESRMLDMLYTQAIDFAEPNAKPETVEELNGRAKDGIGNREIRTSGYGYIGINAGKVPSLYVRRAIMYCINTQECVNYYNTSANAIYRSMSRSNWAYPEGATPYYPYIGGEVPENLDVVDPDYKAYAESLGKKAGDKFTEAEQERFIKWLVEDKGQYTVGSDGVYVKGQDHLNYRFTVVGDETDHPAYNAFEHAAELLNKWGFKVEVKTDTYGLNKLSTGDLAIWAAAWSSTIDPDMYQVYHKDSTASSTLNWGYKQILQNAGGKYDTEYDIVVNQLSPLIEQARETDVQAQRKRLYSDALDLVMELAVELPTYQRNDLFAYSTYKIDESTFTPVDDLSPYRGLTADLHLVSLNTAK